jgi:hypothetical protein
MGQRNLFDAPKSRIAGVITAAQPRAGTSEARVVRLLAPPVIRHLAHADLADCPLCSGPTRPEHPPVATSRRSLQACIASLPLQSSLMSKTYLKSDHFNGGGSGPQLATATARRNRPPANQAAEAAHAACRTRTVRNIFGECALKRGVRAPIIFR